MSATQSQTGQPCQSVRCWLGNQRWTNGRAPVETDNVAWIEPGAFKSILRGVAWLMDQAVPAPTLFK